jgi:hypothetical protein
MASTTAAAGPAVAAPAPAAPKQPHGESKPRLMILKMQVENFKSYGGVKEIGPFHKSFSSVVGPNGSGKSNVIDAMLFVFGKKSSKLRLNKVSAAAAPAARGQGDGQRGPFPLAEPKRSPHTFCRARATPLLPLAALRAHPQVGRVPGPRLRPRHGLLPGHHRRALDRR